MELQGRDRLKIWVGGLAQETTKETLNAYFYQFGEVDSYVMVDSATGRSRGFGFVNFTDEAAMNTVLGMSHEIDGAVVRVDWKGNNPKYSGHHSDKYHGYSAGRDGPPQRSEPRRSHPGDNLKIWVGGLSQSTDKHSLDYYFKQFGHADSIVMMDGATGRSRGFGFVNFYDESVFNTVLHMQHEIDGAVVRIDVHGNSDRQAAGRPGGNRDSYTPRHSYAPADDSYAPRRSYASADHGHDLGSAHVAAHTPRGAVESPPTQLKIWVGGLSQNTSKSSLDAYFNQFGQANSIVMMDGATGRSRGFGFVDFFDELTYNAVLDIQHTIDGTPVRVDRHGNSHKQAAGRSESHAGGHIRTIVARNHSPPPVAPMAQSQAPAVPTGREPMPGMDSQRDRLKIWVGGLAQHTTKHSLDTYFHQFGEASSYVMMDSTSGRSRGFGFVNFFDEAVMNTVLSLDHEIDGVRVRVDSKGNNPGSSKPHLGIGSGGDLGQSSSIVGLTGNLGASAPREALEVQNRLKIWVGGLGQSTTKHSLDAYFQQFGEADSIVMIDSATGRSRGFGFVNFTDELVLNAVLDMQHVIDGAPVRVDRHGNSEKQLAGISGKSGPSAPPVFSAPASPPVGVGQDRRKMKIWIGGLSQSTTKQSLDAYFGKWGHADSIVMRDGSTGRSRGFGFVNFSDPAVMDLIMTMDHEIDGVKVRVSVYGDHQKDAGTAGGDGLQAAQAQVLALQQQQQQLLALQQQSSDLSGVNAQAAATQIVNNALSQIVQLIGTLQQAQQQPAQQPAGSGNRYSPY